MRLITTLVDLILNPRVKHKSNKNPFKRTGIHPRSDQRPQASPLRKLLVNPPLLIGLIVVLGLFLVALFGPLWAPYNPYLTSRPIVTHYDPKEQMLIDPPLPPSSEFLFGTDQWGTDLLSLLLYGARTTLVACTLITVIRLLLGVMLGGISGWNKGHIVDQTIMGIVGISASIPILISSMILIYALDIRRGLPVFIVALSLLGWTEIAQFVRSEFIVLKKMPFIEGAHSLGLKDYALAIRHVLPNILPSLLIITFLEMGAVMMLMGELGFIGVYIGGGSRISVEVDLDIREVFQLIEVPEWGAMLSEGFRYLRSKPFVVIPPALAFFVSVVGFNTLGEGLRRHINEYGLNTAFLLRKRILIILGFIVIASLYIIQQTGPAPWFTRAALSFSGNRAYQDTLTLTNMEGRGNGQPGGIQAAQHIVAGYAANGLQPAWKHNSYIYPIDAHIARPIEQPELVLYQPDGAVSKSFSHQQDFSYVIDGHGGSGYAKAPLTFVGFQNSDTLSQETYQGLDLRGKIVLLQEGNAPENFPTEALIRGAQGVIWITSNDDEVFYSEMLHTNNDKDFLRFPQLPIFKIRPMVANAILVNDGLTIPDLFIPKRRAEPTNFGWFKYDLSAQIHMSLTLQEAEPYVINNVIGFLPGSDFDHSDELVILLAHYDGLGIDPNDTAYLAANNNGSGIATLLEIANLWNRKGFNPRRPVLFVAWGAGAQEYLGIVDFINDSSNFRRLIAADLNQQVSPWLILQIDNTGGGGDAIQVNGDVPERYLELIHETTKQLNIEFIIDKKTQLVPDGIEGRVPWIHLKWAQTLIPPAEDTPDRLQPQRFQKFGELLTLMLTKLVRQVND